ncbi:MAG TPA: cyclic nucleotide-binding domain-containing protein [Candidatus Binatia bacterium]|nr:cyclic nucleotide-binding domain-containing protein [Candidatus Binatia bacterium]
MSALSRLARSLGIEAGEGRVFAWGAATLFLIGWASVSLTNVAETFFLKRIGVTRLPIVFLVNSLLLVGTTYTVSRIAARRAHRRVLATTFAGLGGMVALLWLLVLGHVRPVFVLLVIASKQLDAIALIVFWTVLGGLLHGRQAKRLYAPMIAGGTLGRILGSFASGIIGGAFGIPALLPAAAIAVGLAGLLAARVHSTVPARVTRMTARRPAAGSAAGLGKFGQLWRESRLFQLLVFSALCAGTLGPMLYFQFSYIVDAATRGVNGEMRLLDMYAKVRGFINVGVLAMQLVGTPRVFRRIGVPLAATLSPLVYLVGFFGVSTRLDLPSGIGAVGSANLQDHAIQEPAQRILVTLLPERARAAATSLIEGPVQRLGSAFGNILVLGALAVSTPAWVGFTALPIAALWLAIAVVLWRIYPTLLIEVAATGPMHADVAQLLPELVDPGTLRVLTASLVDPDPRRCRAACALVIEAPWRRAVATLARALRAAPRANRPLLSETLHDWLERHPAAHHPMDAAARDLEPLLTDTGALSAVERAHLVETYARLLPVRGADARGAPVLTALLHDPVPAVRLAAQVHWQRAGYTRTAGEELHAVLADAFAGDDPAVHHIAIEALRATLLTMDGARLRSVTQAQRWQTLLGLLTERLDDPHDRIRAAQVLADVAAHHGARLAAVAEVAVSHVDDHDPRVRAAILRFIGHVRLEQHTALLIERLAASDVQEAAAAAAALGELGPAAMNTLLRTLERGKRPLRAATLKILREMPVDAATLRSLIDGEINLVRHVLLQISGLSRGAAADVVLQRLNERVAEGLHTTLLLLAMLLHEHRIATLGRLLAQSTDRRRHAVLLEALEALLPPAEAAPLVPLLEQAEISTVALTAAHALGREPPTFDEAVRATLSDHDRLTRTLLAATLDPETRTRLAPAGQPPGSATPAAGAELQRHEAGAPGGHEEVMANRVDILLYLRGLDLFSRVSTRDLSELAGVVHEENYPSGAAIVREGDFGDCMYILVEGEVSITREGHLIKRLKPGEFFGEMSLFDGETRSATASATTRLRLLRLERTDLLHLMDEQPSIAIAMCQTLSSRVRDLISQIESREPKDDSGSGPPRH